VTVAVVRRGTTLG